MIQGRNKNGFGRCDRINNWYENKYIKLWGMYDWVTVCQQGQTDNAQTGLMPQNTNNNIASIPHKA